MGRDHPVTHQSKSSDPVGRRQRAPKVRRRGGRAKEELGRAKEELGRLPARAHFPPTL